MRTPIILTVVTLVMAAGLAEAQPSLRHDGSELFMSVAWAHIFRAEDRTLGDRPDIGAGVRLPLGRRVGVELEVNRTLDLHADAAPCGLVAGCEGAAREGLLDATLASANVYGRLARGRVEPFVIGGVGGLWTRSVSSVTTVRGGIGVISEVETRDIGLAISAGAGIDVALTPALSVRPQIRIYDSTAMSRVNLTIIRTSVAAGWRF
jgi:opacity protein-like surface antigen